MKSGQEGLSGLLSPFADPAARRVVARYIPSLFSAGSTADHWVESRDSGIGLIELAGPYADYQSIMDGTRSLEAVWGLQQEHFPRHLLSLGPIVEGDPSASIIEEWVRRQGLLCRVAPIDRAPILGISGSWQDYYDAKRGKFWHNIRRAERMLGEELGAARFSIASSPEEVASSFPACISLYRTNWNRMTSRSYFLSEAGGDLLRDMLVELAREGKAEIARLEQGGRLLAFSLGMTIDSVYYFYVFATSKQAEYARYSVGKIFLRHLFESVFTRGFRAFDFMSGEEPYKLEWTRASRGRVIYFIGPDNCSSRARLSFLLAARRLKSSLKNNQLLRGALRCVSNLRRHDNRFSKP